MELQVEYKYLEGYLPTPRCRKLRYRDAEGSLSVTVTEIKGEDAPVAFIVENYDNSKKEYRYYDGELWTKVQWRDLHCEKTGLLPLSELQWYIHGVYAYWNCSRDEIEESYRKGAERYLIIDNIVYQVTGEPRYVAMFFGLGHNHGGTSLMIAEYYNSNISKDCYFNALERQKAIEFTKQRAIRRGDTDDVDKIGKSYDIKVLIPDAVKCNPQEEHGDGDPFLNKLQGMTEISSSASESAILSLCLLGSEMNKKY